MTPSDPRGQCDPQNVKQMLRRLGFESFDHARMATRFYAQDMDKQARFSLPFLLFPCVVQFAQQNLNVELRGITPTHERQELNVRHTWRLDFPVAFPSGIGGMSIEFLLYGGTHDKIKDLVSRGFSTSHFASKKRVFGAGHLPVRLLDESHAGDASRRFGQRDGRADDAENKFPRGHIGYVVYCEVRVPKVVPMEKRDKTNEGLNPGLMHVMRGHHMSKKKMLLTTAYGQKVRVRRGPFVDAPPSKVEEEPEADEQPLAYNDFFVLDPRVIRPVILVEVEVGDRFRLGF
ncbi:hypothetical protein M3Y99_00608000 [Aphelenchoides fujianensis]|nr:hypothetical protein M3Y99_00608000 [Aphelenchoides fujianensis]